MPGDAPRVVSTLTSPFPLSVFLALDIGNSASKLGLHNGSSWIRVERVIRNDEDPSSQLLSSSHPERSELNSGVLDLLQDISAEAAGIASVVPDLAVQLLGLSGGLRLNKRCGC